MQVLVGIISSLIVFPINLIVVQIFRNVRPKPKIKPKKQQLSPPALSFTEENLENYNQLKESSDESAKGSSNSLDSSREKNNRTRLSINDVHTDVDRASFTDSPLLIDRRLSTTFEIGKRQSFPSDSPEVEMNADFVFIFVQLRHLVYAAYCCGSKRGILYLTTSCMWPGFCCSSSPLDLLRSSSFTAWSLKISGPFSGCFRRVCHSCRMCSSHSHSRYEQTVYKELLTNEFLRYAKSLRKGDCYIELNSTDTGFGMTQIPLRVREKHQP